MNKKEITTKDLMALNELMTFENWIAVKLQACSENSTERSLKTLFKDMAKVHLTHHERLLAYLEKNMSEGGKK